LTGEDARHSIEKYKGKNIQKKPAGPVWTGEDARRSIEKEMGHAA
jgi:hypothetical protein